MKFLDPATILELDVNIFTKVNKADKPKVIYNFFQLIMLDQIMFQKLPQEKHWSRTNQNRKVIEILEIAAR